MKPLQTTRLHSTEQGKGDDGSESRKTQDTPSRYIQLRGRDTRKPDCGHIPKPVLNLALSLIKLNIIIIFTCMTYYFSTDLEFVEEEKGLDYHLPSPTQMVKLWVKLLASKDLCCFFTHTRVHKHTHTYILKLDMKYSGEIITLEETLFNSSLPSCFIKANNHSNVTMKIPIVFMIMKILNSSVG